MTTNESSSPAARPQRGPGSYFNDVDQLIEKTSLETVLQHYGLPLPAEHAREHRMECVFNPDCADTSYGKLSVSLDAARRIFCHSCQTRGNLLTLIHGLEKRSMPAGGRLRGQEFKDAVAKLRELSGLESPGSAANTRTVEEIATPVRQAVASVVNTPLRRHDKEAARALADLHADLVADVEQMSPEAAQYVRSRKWMTADLLEEWGVGWIPGNGRSLFRKNYLVYTHRNERGEVVSYSGRNLSFEEKYLKWVRDGKPEGKKPAKHRFVSGFHRGVELYGGHASRLDEPYVQDSLERFGVVVAEGMNEVLRMTALKVAAIGLGSNRATDAQVEKIARFARSAGRNRVLLLPDCDEEGEAGFQLLLWRLAEERIDVRLGWSSQMFDGKYANRQPEQLSDDEWAEISGDVELAGKYDPGWRRSGAGGEIGDRRFEGAVSDAGKRRAALRRGPGEVRAGGRDPRRCRSRSIGVVGQLRGSRAPARRRRALIVEPVFGLSERRTGSTVLPR